MSRYSSAQNVPLGSTCPVCESAAADTGQVMDGFSIFACGNCALRFAPHSLAAQVDYDAIYQTPEYQQATAMAARLPPARMIMTVRRHPTYRPFFAEIRYSDGRSLLDVGCGTGIFVHALRQVGWAAVGIDPSQRAVSIARELGPAPILRGTVEDVAKWGIRFDVITAFEVLEHLSRPQAFLRSLQSVLKPEAEVFCTVPNWECESVRTAQRVDWLPPVHKLFFTETALETLFIKSGFRDVRTGSIYADRQGVLGRLRFHAARKRNEALGLWVHARSQ